MPTDLPAGFVPDDQQTPAGFVPDSAQSQKPVPITDKSTIGPQPALAPRLGLDLLKLPTNPTGSIQDAWNAIKGRSSFRTQEEMGNAEQLGKIGGSEASLLFGGPGTGDMAANVSSNVIPNAEHAGQLFQKAMGAAKDVPIDVGATGDSALHIQDLAKRGGSMPKVVRDFLARSTDPEKGPMTYQEARDFYSNASRLSADETKRLTPVMRREVGQFTQSLGNSIRDAASKAGVEPEYSGAMKEYSRAMGLRDFGNRVKEGLIDSVPYLAGGGLGAYAIRKAVKQ
jgi:hypothetical protein